jgi:transposase
LPTSRSAAADDPSRSGPITALAAEVFLGYPTRFADSKALASYVGMIPREYSSGGRQRLPLLPFLWG